VLPDALPWLVVLGLLALPRNRTAGAWWIWAGVACGFGLEALLRSARTVLPSQPIEIFASAILALTFSVAALWLLVGAVERKSRFKAFLLSLAIVGGLGLTAYLVGAITAQNTSQSIELVFEGILVLMCGLIIPAALNLGGALCRRRYRPLALLVWTIISTIVVALLVLLPLLIIALVSNPATVIWKEMFVGMGLLAGLSFAILAPFLALGFANSLFRERLKSLLQLAGGERPAMIVPFSPIEQVAR
jgi:hypothetical protein